MKCGQLFLLGLASVGDRPGFTLLAGEQQAPQQRCPRNNRISRPVPTFRNGRAAVWWWRRRWRVPAPWITRQHRKR
jgi:hypothetical protein